MGKINIEDIKISSSAIDDFFKKELPIKTAGCNRIRVASLGQLSGFHFISNDTLVHLSQQDFWKLGKDDDGHFIERLVDDVNGPVKES